MNPKLKTILFFLLIANITTAFSQKANKTKNSNFQSSDTQNWVYVLKNKKLDPLKVFKMENGTLYVSGESGGYLRTKKNYKSYSMTLEWRWTKTLGNSGVLVHIQPKDTVWPVCYQVQLKANAAGDIICMNGLWAKECTDSITTTVSKKLPSNEKSLGEWNEMKVICKNKSIKVWINGVLQNNITKLTASQGYIGFQNEGTQMEFRKLAIKQLP